MGDWNWNNPSSNEALEAYNYYSYRYNDAENQRRESQRQENTYRNERSSAKSKLSALNTQKTNFEERLAGIERIISILSGTGGLFKDNIPEVISKANKAVIKTDDSFRKSIKCSGNPTAASIEGSFSLKTVEGDANSSAALSLYQAARVQLQEDIEEIKRQIDNLAAIIASLDVKIRNCENIQASLQTSMNSFAYNANHYRHYLYD